MRNRLVIPVVIVRTGCDFNPQCQHVLLGEGCQNALRTRKCASLARAAILTGLGEYKRPMRKRRRKL